MTNVQLLIALVVISIFIAWNIYLWLKIVDVATDLYWMGKRLDLTDKRMGEDIAEARKRIDEINSWRGRAPGTYIEKRHKQ